MPDPAIALLSATLIALLGSLLCWPQHGVIARWQQARRSTERVHREDALKHIYQSEVEGRSPTIESIAGALDLRRNGVARLLARMQADGLLQIANGDICLTSRGREGALHIIRAHRLWEHHLAEETGIGELDWHEQAEIYEHLLSPAETEELAAHLGNPTHDPHGDPIPTAAGDFVQQATQSLTALTSGQTARITHLEDEPAVVYAQLMAEGLHPGMVVRLTESTPEQLRFWSNAGEHVLAPVVAANVFVSPLPTETQMEPRPAPTLADLPTGDTAEVVHLSPRCRGAERRRLMDLGILPGTLITAELVSPSGDPTAYRVRGALIALRHEQAALIQVKATESERFNQ
jgi:DtxR family Mn-dependent transcriptional regulator